MGLSLVVGPAHAGKVGLLLDRYLDLIDRDPWLVVPNQREVDAIERELLARHGALLSGSVSTFEGLFEHVAAANGDRRRLVSTTERAVLLRRAVERVDRSGLGPSASFPGFPDVLGAALAEVEAGLVDPTHLDPGLAALVSAYHGALDELGAWDRDGRRRCAVDRIRGDLAAWTGRPVLAYGFEDLTGAEWALLEALAGRTEVHVSLPYEVGRTAFASLQQTAVDLAALAGDRVVELPPSEGASGSLAQLERKLFVDGADAASLDGSIRFLEGAGRRSTLEVVADDVLSLIAAGTPPEEIAVVSPSLDRVRDVLETTFVSFGIPFAVEAPTRLRATALGHALMSILVFAWAGGSRRELFAFLRSPYSGLSREEVDWYEGRLRGRAVREGSRVREELARLRGRPLPVLELLAEVEPTAAVRELAASMVRNAHGIDAPTTGDDARGDLRAHDGVVGVTRALTALAGLGPPVTPDELFAALERTEVRGERAGAPGRVAVLDLLRARTRLFDAVFVLGLEQGTFPRRGAPTPLLDDETRRRLDEACGARLVRPDSVSRDRYLFYTACTRARRRLVLVREAASDEGTPRDPSPFWQDVCALFAPADVRLHTVRRPLSRLTWPLERAPTDRERVRALAVLAATEPNDAEALAEANGWERRLGRARAAFSRPTGISHPRALALLGGRETVRVTDLERMAGCSAAWFVERYLGPREIDPVIDARLRGSVAHVALQRFYAQLPSAIPGAEQVTPENCEDAVRLMGECVASAVASGVRIDVTEVERRELEQGLLRDLEQLVREEAASGSGFVPRRLEVSFASYELAPGVAVAGKIDRVDGDPLSARGLVVDYKTGNAPSASQIREESKLQLPLYMLVLRDQLGLEPMGGYYMPIGGGRRPRGMLLGGDDAVPGFMPSDYLEPDAFARELEDARADAVALAERMRAGDVRHDPIGGECPAWCDLWRICRKDRA